MLINSGTGFQSVCHERLRSLARERHWSALRLQIHIRFVVLDRDAPCDSCKGYDHLDVGEDEDIKASVCEIVEAGPIPVADQGSRVDDQSHNHEEADGGFYESGGGSWVAWPPETEDDEDKSCQEW